MRLFSLIIVLLLLLDFLSSMVHSPKYHYPVSLMVRICGFMCFRIITASMVSVF